MSGGNENWATPTVRAMVIQQIEDTYHNYGNPTQKNSEEVEKHIFERARTRDDYLQLVARLILHIKEVRGRTANQPAGSNVNSPLNQLIAGANNVAGIRSQNTAAITQQLLQGQFNRQNQIRPGQQVVHHQHLLQPLNPQPINNMNQSPQVAVQGGQIINQQPGTPNAGMFGQTQMQGQGQQFNVVAASPVVNLNVGSPVMQAQKQNVLTPQQQQQLLMQQKNMEQPQRIAAQVPGQSANNPIVVGQGSQFQIPIKPSVSKSSVAPSPAKGVAPSPGQPSPASRAAQSPANPLSVQSTNFQNPPSVESPLPQAEEQAISEKLKEMTKYVEPLLNVITHMPEEHKKEKEKMKGLYDILTKQEKRVRLKVLERCENVLKRIFPDIVPTPPKPGPPQPMGEVLNNVTASAHIMSQVRQNMMPGIIALNAPMISPPPPPRKRLRPESQESDKKSPLPNALQTEVARLYNRFDIKLHPCHPSDKGGVVLTCKCKFDKTIPLPYDLTIRVPSNYPKSEPEYEIKISDDPTLQQTIRSQLQKKLFRLPHSMTFSAIFLSWEQCVKELSDEQY